TALADLLVGYVEAYSLAGTVHPTRDSNLALYLHGSRASASSTNRYARANAAINGSYATLWRPEKPGDEHWIAVDFQRRVTLGRVLLVTSAQASGEPLYPAEAWRVETKAGETWEPVEAKRSHFFIHWNPQLTRWERSTQPSAPPRRAEEYRFPPRPVTSLRFVLKQPKTSPSVYEVEAYAQ
ncbi:MAG: discoidin domain-containing protein, partial [Chloroflexi bacterium]|nr:discoidin domain-containing protein [Chloroflexota bacterium]